MKNANQSTNQDEIECPQCGATIPLSETLRHQLTEEIRRELEVKVGQREKDILLKDKELKDKERKLTEQEKESERRIQKEVSAVVSIRELELKKREAEIATERESIDKRVQDEIKQEKSKLEIQAKKKAEEAVSTEVKDIRAQLQEKQTKLDKAEQDELDMRKRERELVEKVKNVELETARRIARERQKVQEETAKIIEEEHHLKDAEKDKKLQDAIRANDELRRKLQQGSQQTQGEVLELELEELIRTNFPADTIEPVPKGINGADVIQRVNNNRGDSCGVIVWESKHTKDWKDSWIQKLKDDLRLVKGDIVILVSEVLPKDIKNFGMFKGILVASPQCALGLATVIRKQLIELSMTKLATVGKNEKMEVLYSYLTGSEFKQRMEAIVEAFVYMQEDLRSERRTTELRWSKREKQIQRVITNTAGMYGDFQGLIGSSLQTIPALTAGEDAEENKLIDAPEDDEEEPKEEMIDPADIPF
ncbi:MAG TPA: DUF2130 domain-containing protein [Candidatus Paceibacterota bacterium]